MQEDLPQQSRRKKKALLMEKSLQAPFFKGIQLPAHLRWVTINAVGLRLNFTFCAFIESKCELFSARDRGFGPRMQTFERSARYP